MLHGILGKTGTGLFFTGPPTATSLHPTPDFYRNLIDKSIFPGSLATLNGRAQLFPLPFRDSTPHPRSIVFDPFLRRPA